MVKVLKIIKRILRVSSEIVRKIRAIDDSLQYLNRQIIRQNALSEENENLGYFTDDPLDRFVLKGYYYLQNRKENDKERRLFVTSGGISLITLLAIRQKIGSNNKYEDFLVIFGTSPNNHGFLINNKNIADVYAFKKIYIYMQRISSYRFIDFGLAEIDEVYVFANLYFYTCFQKIYPYSKFILFDEGPASCISYPVYNYSQITKVIVHNYLGKINFFLWHNTNKRPTVEFVDELEFANVLSNVQKKLHITLKMENESKKCILVCGPGDVDKSLLKPDIIKGIINALIGKGYKVMFKKHPRDTLDYHFIQDVEFIDTAYPVELYNLNIVAAVNFGGSLGITLSHFNKIACFSKNPTGGKIGVPWLTGLTQMIVSQYTVPIDVLLNFPHEKYSTAELKEKLFELFVEYVKEKPDVSSNENIGKFLKRNKGRLDKANFKLDNFLW
jgi:hypothetical protein